MPHFCAAFLIDRTMNEISYTVIRSRRKTVSLEITRDLAVVVRAPLTMSQGEIDRFVASREAWLREHYARQQQRTEQAEGSQEKIFFHFVFTSWIQNTSLRYPRCQRTGSLRL